MFDFKRKVKTWAHANTDITYLENKEQALENLRGIKDRIFDLVTSIDDDAKFKLNFLNNTLNTAFIPKNIANYNQELEQHLLLMKALEKSFEEFIIAKIDTILKDNSYKTSMLKSKITTENLAINECRSKYPEASNLPLITCGKDVIDIEEYVNQVIAQFHSSIEYIEVLYRSRLENKYGKHR